MVEKEDNPYGYTYRATNIVKGKLYFGQTTTSRWNEGKIPIEERWKEEVREAYSRAARGENLRYIENAIIKYGPENFELRQEDIAHNQKELDRKETEHIRDYDSMNPDKGYNMTEGGEGGRMSEMAKEKMSKSGSEKWQRDLEYREKQTKERQERAEKNPDWVQKMTEINREKAKNPDWKEKLSQAGTDKWKEGKYNEKQTKERQERAKDLDWVQKMTEINRERAKNPEWREKMSQIGTNKWQEPEYRGKQNQERRARGKNPDFIQKMTEINRERARDPLWLAKMREINKQYRKEIPDKKEFLNEIKESTPKNEMLQKYDMGGKTLNRRVREMFGPDGPKNYTELKDYMQDRNVNEVLKDIEERSKAKEVKPSSQGDKTQDKGESKPQDKPKEVPQGDTKKGDKEEKKETPKVDDKGSNPEKDPEVPTKEKEQESTEKEKATDDKSEEMISDVPKQEEKDYAGIDKGVSGEGAPEKKGDIGGAFESSIIRGSDFIKVIDRKTKERGSKGIIGKDTRLTSGVHVIGKKFVNPPQPTGKGGKHSDFSGLNINLNVDFEHTDMSISGGGDGGGSSEGGGDDGDSIDYETIDDDDKVDEATTEQDGEGGSEVKERFWES